MRRASTTIAMLLLAVLLLSACGTSSDNANSDLGTSGDSSIGNADGSSALDASDGGLIFTVDSYDNESKGVVETISFSNIPLSSNGSQTLRFTVSEYTRAFLITVIGSQSVLHGFRELRDPLGNVVYHSDQMGWCSVCLTRALPGFESSSMLVPRRTQEALVPGEYQLQVMTNSLDETVADVEVTFYKSSNELRHGKLDLNLFFTGVAGVTSQNAKDNLVLQQALSEIRQILLQADIVVDQVRYYDAPGELSNIQTTYYGDSDLAQLLRTSKGAEPGVNIFFVKSINGALGFSGGIPGPNRHGLGTSGVAIAWPGSDTDEYLGSVTAHELCHYLGLFHSSEADGSEDILDDTAPDDKTNLMYWAGDTQKTGFLIEVNNRISPGQRFLLLNNPLLHLK